MRVSLKLPEALRRSCGNRAQVDLEGDSVGAVLRDLAERFPETLGRALDERARLQPHLVVILNDRVLEREVQYETPLACGDELELFTAASGGSGE